MSGLAKKSIHFTELSSINFDNLRVKFYDKSHTVYLKGFYQSYHIQNRKILLLK